MYEFEMEALPESEWETEFEAEYAKPVAKPSNSRLSLLASEFHDLGCRFAGQCFSNAPANSFVRGPHGIVVEMAVSRRRLRLRVPQQLANHRQPHAGARADAGKRVPQVM